MNFKQILISLFISITLLSCEKKPAHLSPECEKKFKELQSNIPNLNQSVFHSKCGTKHMMEIQKASEQKYGSNTAFLQRAIQVMNDHGITSGSAVDLGSGTGVWTKYLLQTGNWRVHAIDLYQPSLDDLSQSVPPEAKERLTLHNADFRSVSFPEQVDVVIANNSLCFVPREELGPVLDNIYNSLKPGGILAVTFWGDKDVRGEDPDLSTFTPDEVKKLFEGKYNIISCCPFEKGVAPNLDDDIVTWNVIYTIVQKPF